MYVVKLKGETIGNAHISLRISSLIERKFPSNLVIIPSFRSPFVLVSWATKTNGEWDERSTLIWLSSFKVFISEKLRISEKKYNLNQEVYVIGNLLLDIIE